MVAQYNLTSFYFTGCDGGVGGGSPVTLSGYPSPVMHSMLLLCCYSATPLLVCYYSASPLNSLGETLGCATLGVQPCQILNSIILRF